MPKVSGLLKTVLSNPSSVTGAWIRPMGDRPDGDGVVLDEQVRVPIVGGAVSFTAVPGPAALILEYAGSRTTNLKLMVGEADSSLAESVRAAAVANHLDSYRLAQLVGMIEATQGNAQSASAAAVRAESARNEAEAMVVAKLAARSSRMILFHGTGTPALSDFPDLKIGDVIVRVHDEFKWKVEE